MDPNLYRTRTTDSSAVADDDDDEYNLHSPSHVNPRRSPPPLQSSSNATNLSASTHKNVPAKSTSSTAIDDTPDAGFNVSLAQTPHHHRPPSVSSVETTDLMDHRKHQRASTFSQKPRPGTKPGTSSGADPIVGPGAAGRPRGKSTSDRTPFSPFGRSSTVPFSAASGSGPGARAWPPSSSLSSAEPFGVSPAIGPPDVTASAVDAAIPKSRGDNSTTNTSSTAPSLSKETTPSNQFMARRMSASATMSSPSRSFGPPGRAQTASNPFSQSSAAAKKGKSSHQGGAGGNDFASHTSPLLSDPSYTARDTYRSISPNTPAEQVTGRLDADDSDFEDSYQQKDPLAQILHRKSFASSEHDGLLGSEPISRRSSRVSSLQDVCLPIDAQSILPSDGRPTFDVSYLEEFSSNEQKELELLQASLPLEPSIITNHPASVTALRASVAGADTLSSTRFRPYRVVPWANNTPSSNIPGSSSSAGAEGAFGRGGMSSGAYGGPNDPSSNGASGAHRRNKRDKYTDPYFTDNPHHNHRGPPLRFTYFREDIDATIHSPSISGLLQDGQTFDDLFNLSYLNQSPLVSHANNSAAATTGLQTPELSNLTPQPTSTSAATAVGSATPSGSGSAGFSGTLSESAAVAANTAARHVLSLERNLSRVSSPSTHQLATSNVTAANTPNNGGSALSPGTAGPEGTGAVPSPRIPLMDPNHAQYHPQQLASTVSVAAAAAAAAMANSLSQPQQQYDPSPFWLDVMNPTEEEMKVLSKAFGIHPLTTEDIFLNEPREKVELFRNYYLVCFRSFDINDERSKRSRASHSTEEKSAYGKYFDGDGDVRKSSISMTTGRDGSSGPKRRHTTHHHRQQKHMKHGSVNNHHHHKSRSKESELTPLNMYIIVFHEGVITFHFSPTPHPMNVRRRIRLLRDYITLSSDWISYALIDDITDGFAPMIEAIEEEVNHIEDEILSMHTEWSDGSGPETESDEGYDSSASEKSGYSTSSETGAERYPRRSSEKQRRKRAVERFTAEMIAEERASIAGMSSDEDLERHAADSGRKSDVGHQQGNHNGAPFRFNGEPSSAPHHAADTFGGTNHVKSGTSGHKPNPSFTSRLQAKLSARNARGSTVGPNGGILGNPEGPLEYMHHRDAYDPEDPVNDYTKLDSGIHSLGASAPPASTGNRRRSNQSGRVLPRDIVGSYSDVPGALHTQHHIIVDDEDEDDDSYDRYLSHDAASRQSLLAKSKGGSKSYYADSIRSSASSHKSGHSYRSRKSRKSRVSRKSSRSSRAGGGGSSMSSSMSSSSWSSTASGRWKEKGDMLRRIGECRKRIMSVLRLLGSKADVIKGFSKRCNEQWEVAPRYEIGLYLGDIQDHIVTMVQSLNHCEKLLARSHSNYLAQINIDMTRVNNEMNDVLSKITVLGTIVLPMNIVTGLWGMNVIVPGQFVESLTWFWSITGTLFLFGCISFFIARRVYGIA